MVTRIELESEERQVIKCRGVAQSGSASALGAEGRGFESLRPDHRKASDITSDMADSGHASAFFYHPRMCKNYANQCAAVFMQWRLQGHPCTLSRGFPRRLCSQANRCAHSMTVFELRTTNA
jgi:hypothetical protein